MIFWKHQRCLGWLHTEMGTNEWSCSYDIPGLNILRVTNVDSGVNIIKSRLHGQKILLIIDDVDQLDQLKYLAGSSDWFDAGSRIIITTRDQHLLHAHGVEFTYQVKEVQSDEALELFSSNAFRTSRVPDDYQELACSLVGYAQGNPLILKNMGSSLYGRSIEAWLSELERLKNLQSKGLNEVGSLEMPEADKSEADDVDGVKATETNKGSPGGDETSPDTQKKD
ncbi:unnamed protein product [Prunus armeniaca]